MECCHCAGTVLCGSLLL